MTKGRIPGVDLRVHHILPRVPHNAPIIIMQGTFSEHSVRVERMPVSLHPNCKKHLKSTKVDAKYNLQTWVPKTRANKTKRRIPGVELLVQSHCASIITINWRCAKNRQKGGIVCLYLHFFFFFLTVVNHIPFYAWDPPPTAGCRGSTCSNTFNGPVVFSVITRG
jgi:hypothetical protein